MNKMIFIFLLLYSSLSFATFCDPSIPKYPTYNKTLDTIGDSITWWQDGEKFRCLLLDKGLKVDFVGSFVDDYGYNHDGHGGDTSKQVLERIVTIPISDNYFLLIGTNDHIDAAITVNNIIKISEQLAIKNMDAKIYISTLLPKTDPFSTISTKINQLLRNTKLCNQCQIVDLGAHIESLPNWKKFFPDGLHPNADGYNAMVDYLIPILSS